MPNHITLEIRGLKEAAIAVGRWGEEVQRQVARAAQAEANYAVAEMRRRVPIGPTGNLLKGLARVTVDGTTATIRATAPHTHLVEWGHRIVTRSGRETGKQAKRATPSFFVVPAMDARRRFFNQVKDILGHPIPVLDVTMTVKET